MRTTSNVDKIGIREVIMHLKKNNFSHDSVAHLLTVAYSHQHEH